jgi:hypothetical protein
MITDDTEARRARRCGGAHAFAGRSSPGRPRPRRARRAHALTWPALAPQVRYVVGASMVTMPNDDAEARLQGATEEASSDVERLSAELAEIQGAMGKLKAVLYAKFGDSINLEE